MSQKKHDQDPGDLLEDLNFVDICDEPHAEGNGSCQLRGRYSHEGHASLHAPKSERV